jgi:hypothetical protein
MDLPHRGYFAEVPVGADAAAGGVAAVIVIDSDDDRAAGEHDGTAEVESVDGGGTSEVITISDDDDDVTTALDTSDDGGTTELESDTDNEADSLTLAIRGTVFDGFMHGRRSQEHDGVASSGEAVVLKAEPRLPPLPRPDARAVSVRDALHRSLGMLETSVAHLVFDMLSQPAVFAVTAEFEPKRRGYSRESAPYVDITVRRIHNDPM